jgi:DNA-directed RNA polymerase subunit N (RpoN/RPB10)
MDDPIKVVSSFKSAIEDLKLKFEVLPAEPALEEYCCRRMKIKSAAKEWIMPIFDEFDDLKEPPCLMYLQLALMEIEQYEETDDYLVWCKELGLQVADPVCRSMYFDLREICPQLKEIFKGKVEAASNWDIQMNTHVADALRNTRI